MSDDPEVLAERLRTAFDLCEPGESMRRAQLRREHPDARPGSWRGSGRGEELDEARRALALVTRRGFQRGRDLDAALDSALSEFRQ
jgi:hypothetical protein